jgi:7-keto-8-aminopelargonate synthetase-like enzyme
MASGQVVQGGHRTIIASGAEIIPACAIDHTHSNCSARPPRGATRPGYDAVRSQKACAAYGVRVGCFRPPAVPRGQSCLRLAGRASLTEDDFAAAARALAAVREHGK